MGLACCVIVTGGVLPSSFHSGISAADGVVRFMGRFKSEELNQIRLERPSLRP